MKKLTKKVAEQLIHRIVPGIKVETATGYGCIGAYIARTPEMTIDCVYCHIEPTPWKHIRLRIDTGAAHSITMLYDPETLERDCNAEYDEDKEAFNEKWEQMREEWEIEWNRNH